MAGLFSSPSPPSPPPAPSLQDKSVQEAAADAVRRRQRAKGFRSTILNDQFLQLGGLKTTMGS